MAELDLDFSPAYWVDHHRPVGTEIVDYESASWNSVAKMRNALNGLNATYYTMARLNSMTKNDMAYAMRVLTANISPLAQVNEEPADEPETTSTESDK